MSTPLAAALSRLRAGENYKSALEQLLLELSADQADELMMLLKESRGAFGLLLPAGTGPGRRALFLGDPLSGTPIALATLGYSVTLGYAANLGGDDRRRLALARYRGRAQTSAGLSAIELGRDSQLPFADQAFNLVVQEGGLPCQATGWGYDPQELRRITHGTLVAIADNRFGYKRSTGLRGQFVKHPGVLLREALWPSRGERGRLGTLSAVRGEWPRARAFSLYPHAREFSHVVALDEPFPALTVRRRERRNGLKMLGRRLGLFPWLTPSFAIIAQRGTGTRAGLKGATDSGAETLACRLIAEVATAATTTGETLPQVDVLIATRSNDAILHTALPGRGEDDPNGRWTLHVPLQPGKQRMVEIHHSWLVDLRSRFPSLPVPEPLYVSSQTQTAPGLGQRDAAERLQLGSLTMAAERRLPGITGADLTGDRPATARMFREVAAHFADLIVKPARTIDGAQFERLVGARVELAVRHVPNPGTRKALLRLRDAARERMLGRPMPLTIYHADLRSKHVQVQPSGQVIGYLDWGASEAAFLPYVDLLHLVLHQRKQEEGCSFGEAWALARQPERLRQHEREPLDQYCRAIDLDADVRSAIEGLYPALVAGMAERNWDYSRPDWVHRQFAL